MLLLAVVMAARTWAEAPAPAPAEPTLEGADSRRLDKAMAPSVAQARKTWPQVKQRALSGQLTGQALFVTVRLFEGALFEQCFVRVKKIDGDTIIGVIANKLSVLKQKQPGERVSFRESELLDWMISKPDGTEEGNVVGKFLSTYQPAP
jgi:uncharacterized protein YegJ (DUF2314 family)